MRKRPVFILTYDYPPNDGGIARLCYEIKRGLEELAIPVTVVTLMAKGSDLEDDLNVVRISGKRGVVEWRLFSYIRKHTFVDDIILTGMFHPEGLLSVLAGRKTYMLAHGAELLSGKSFFRRVIWNIYRKWVLKEAETVIANSRYTRDLVFRCSPKAESVSIPLFVDTSYFRPTVPKMDDGLLHLCSVSRLLKFKGQDFIIKTIASLPDVYRCKIRLKIAGKGVYKSELERLVEQLNLSNIVTFSGFLPDAHLCDFYSSADVFILCTREEPENQNVEGFGLVFLEAQACGTAVIGTKTGGISDAVSEGNGGWLIRQDSEKELHVLLKQLIDDPILKKEEGKKARRRVLEEMNRERYIQQLMRIIEIDDTI